MATRPAWCSRPSRSRPTPPRPRPRAPGPGSPRARSEPKRPSPRPQGSRQRRAVADTSVVPSTSSGTVVGGRRSAVAFRGLRAASPGPRPASSPHCRSSAAVAVTSTPVVERPSTGSGTAVLRDETPEPAVTAAATTAVPPPRSPQRPPSLRRAQGPGSAQRPLPSAARRSAVAFLAPRVASPGRRPDSRFPQSPPRPPLWPPQRCPRSLSALRQAQEPRFCETKRPSLRPLPSQRPRRRPLRPGRVRDFRERRPRPRPLPRQPQHPWLRHPSPQPPQWPRHPWLSRIVPRCRSPGRCGRGPRRVNRPAPRAEPKRYRAVHRGAVDGCGADRWGRAAVRGGHGGAVRAVVVEPAVHGRLRRRPTRGSTSCRRGRRWGCRRGWVGSISSTCS